MPVELLKKFKRIGATPSLEAAKELEKPDSAKWSWHNPVVFEMRLTGKGFAANRLATRLGAEVTKEQLVKMVSLARGENLEKQGIGVEIKAGGDWKKALITLYYGPSRETLEAAWYRKKAGPGRPLKR